MAKMKTLTVNGKTYTVDDPDSVSFENPQDLTEAQKLQARENIGAAGIGDTAVGADAWSSRNIVDKLCPAFSEKGAVVTCNPVEGYPLQVVSNIVSVQAGSGDPSPDNIRPITGHTGTVLHRCGENLLKLQGRTLVTSGAFDAETKRPMNGNKLFVGISHNNYFNPAVIAQHTLTETGITFTSTFQSYGVGFDIPVCPGATYTASCAEENQIGMIFYRADGTHISYAFEADGTITKTAPADGAWCLVTVTAAKTNTPVSASDLQVNIGTAPLPFVSCKGDTFAADFGRTVYGGSYDWQSGVLIDEYAMLQFDGTETFFKNETGTGLFYNTGNPADDRKQACICSHLPGTRTGAYNGQDKTASVYNGNVYICDSRFETVDDLKAYLQEQDAAGTPFTVVYKRAEPVLQQLTQQEIPALSGSNTLYSTTGDTAVTGRADPPTVIGNQQERINRILDRVAALEAAAVSNT